MIKHTMRTTTSHSLLHQAHLRCVVAWRLFSILWLCVSIVFMPQYALALQSPATASADEALMWNLNADTIITLPGKTIVEATGNVLLTRGNDTLKADFARFFSDTQWVYLEGNVFVKMGRDTLRAASAEFDLASSTGWLKDGHVFMEGPHVYFSGEQMIKHAGDRYTFTDAKITVCDGDVPAWSLQAESATVEIDGYATLYHSNLLIQNNNVLYSPFMVLPAKTSRQSGFLLPDYGYSTKRGAYYTQPYFHVIDESSDLTFYGTVMTEIGPTLGIEYRSQPYSHQKTWLMASFGYDHKTITNSYDNDVHSGSDSVRTNHERFWLRGMADGMVGTSGWQYRSNIDYVSDQNYLREFDDDMFGFEYSRDALFGMFGRDLTNENEKRISAINLSKDWERLSFVASAQYTQDPYLGNGNLSRSHDETVQRFPQFDIFFNKSRIIPSIPLEFEAQVQTAYFHREEGTSGMRTEITPLLSIPLDLKFLSFIGSVGLHQTFYETSTVSNTSPLDPYNTSTTSPMQTGTSRTLVNYNFKAFTEANRIWQLNAKPLPATKENLGKTSWTALRHDMQPRVEYANTPRKYQGDNPFYTTEDRILATNELTYSITNILTRKGSRISMSGTDKDATPTTNTVYEDLARLRIAAGYDFEEEQRSRFRNEYKRRPFMDILTELEIYMTSWASFTGKLYLSPYDAETTRLDYGINLQYKEYLKWYTGMSYRTEEYNFRKRFRYDNLDDIHTTIPEELMHNRFDITLTPEWSIILDDYRDLRRGSSFGKTYDQAFSISYETQCYRFIGTYRYDEYDTSFSIMLEIPGIFE